MVGYVLLISIAVALSTAVFFYLKLYLPSDKQDCYQDINLVIDSVGCNIISFTASTVSINFTNKGLFSIDGVFIKIGESNRIFRKTINNPDDALSSRCNGPTEANLKPGATFCGTYNYDSGTAGVKEISVQPFIWVENKAVLCPDVIVSRKIICTVAPV
ncbi:MAG: hypothetical protein AABX96_04185 [Nanoarchaeota archaeon]